MSINRSKSNSISRLQRPPPITLNSSDSDLLQVDGPGGVSPRGRPSSRSLTPISASHSPDRARAPHSPLSQSPLTPSSPLPLPYLTTAQAPFSSSTSTTNSSPITSQFPGSVSTERLIPPSAIPTRFREYSDSIASRRSSWDSLASADHRYGVYGNGDPFGDSRAGSRAQSPDRYQSTDNLTNSISEKYNISPVNGGLYDGPEPDDDLHDPNVNDDMKETLFTKRGIINIGGLALIVLGLMMLFVGYPILTFAVEQVARNAEKGCEGPLCLDSGEVPLLKNVRFKLIDPDTPKSAYTKKSASGKTLKLAFSDEFNQPNRSFFTDDDPFWEAVDIHYAATQDLEWYDPDAITTKDGFLEIEFAKFLNHDLAYRSGMLQSWNKLCFKGGMIEASISLPGRGDVSGFWGSFWTMGNLGRPGYLASTEGMWPYSYHDGCDAGITANQSSSDGISFLPGMKLPGCTCPGEDHPNRGKARSAPEIDGIEASVGVIDDATGKRAGVASQSAQVAPFDLWYQPDYDHVAVYNPEFTSMNAYRGGFFQEALSGLTVLNNDWYDGKEYQTYGFEYEPGDDGMIEWHVGDMKTWRMNAGATGANGNIGARPIPVEPMTVILNFGMSPSFAALDFEELHKLMPAKMRVDYVRIYQEEGKELITCDPPGYPTTQYIEEHKDAFYNANITLWSKTEYGWPRNEYVHGCDNKKGDR